MRFIVAQLGARMHYAVPRILHRAGMLERLCTDICAVKGWPRLLRAVPGPLRPAGLRHLLVRVPEGVPRARITAFTSFGLEYARRRARARTPSESTAVHLWAGRTFCEAVVAERLGEAAGVYAFGCAALELLRFARERGARAVLEQTIAPKEIERRLLDEESEAFPSWEDRAPRDANFDAFVARERAEWDAADVIVCGSEFVREGVASSGGPADRCVVVPYGVDSRFRVEKEPRGSGPLRVLTVGAVGLRKGSPYVMRAARILRDKARFRMVGGTRVRGGALDDLGREVELVGPVPRSEILSHYAWADVFLLPSICEGSAVVCYEALAAGLPVVTTPNAGSVVRDGIDGFVVPIRAPQAMAGKLDLLASDPGLLENMSRSARMRAREYDLAAYGERLVGALSVTEADGCS